MKKAGDYGLLIGIIMVFAMGGSALGQDFSYPFSFESPFEVTEVYEAYKTATSEGGVRVGPFKFKPGVQVNATYTDNPRYRTYDTQSSLLFTVDPTLTFTLAKGGQWKDRVSFGYDADLGAYTRVTGNDYTRHTLWVNIDLMKRPEFYTRLREAVTYTDDPYGNDEYIGLGTANRRFLNQTDFVVGRNLPRGYAAELGYENLWENYLSAAYEEWSNLGHLFKPTLLYELTGKTKLLVQYNFGYRNYYDQPSSTSPDYIVSEGMAGFRWAATARLTGELKAGYAWRQFINDIDEFGNPFKDESTPVYSAALSYMVSPKTTASLNIYRQFQYGGFSGGAISNPAIFQDAYTRNAFGLTVSTKTRPTLSFSVSGSYYLDQYDPTHIYPDRTDQWVQAGINFRHQVKRWLWWGLGYQFQKRDSEAFNQGYTENSVTASLGASY